MNNTWKTILEIIKAIVNILLGYAAGSSGLI